MPRPFSAFQAHENQVFLDSLGRSGNSRMAAREAGRALSSFHHRRKTHAEFAQRWDAAVASVHARLHLAGGKRGPEPPPGRAGANGKRTGPGLRRDDGRGLRTKGGEPMVVRTRSGRLQVRLAQPGKLTQAAEQAFLYALSATANVRLSAAAAGASARAFYRRRRQNPVFAREMRLALKMGWERLEMQSLAAALPENHAHDRWRECEPAAMPRLKWDQAFQLLCLHDKSVHLSWEQPHRRKRRGESDDAYVERLRAMWRVEKALEAEGEALRRAARFEASGRWRHEAEPPPPELPPLELVTGWSRASGRPPHNERRALFGGWRIEEMERKRRRG